jgi:ATP-dependent helicase/nuclease subunit B
MLRVLKSHSAAERIAAATEFIHSFTPATEITIIGASRDAVDDFVRNIASSSQATFGLYRFSLTQFAARLATARLAGSGIAPNSAVGAEALAARTVHEALARTDLKYFKPIATFPGFARAVSRTMFDLRAAGLAPEKLKNLQEPGPENAVLLEGFEEQIKGALLADRAMLLRAAIEEVRDGTEFVKCPLLFLDVPVHSALERTFVVELVGVSKELLFTCPAADLRTLDNLKSISELEEIPQVREQGTSSLARLRTYLFTESVPPESKRDGEVIFFSAPGEERESVEIARRILVEAEKGVPFDRMAVLLRTPEVYAGLIDAALRRAGIPAYFVRGSRRPDPSGRALVALLACAAERLSARRFAEYLSFAQVPEITQEGARSQGTVDFMPPEDEALGSVAAMPDVSFPDTSRDDGSNNTQNIDGLQLEGSLRAPWKWEELLVDAAVIGSKERWARRLAGLQKQFQQQLAEYGKEEPDSPRVEGMQRKLRNLQYLSAFALPVIDELAALPETATWGDWITALEKLVPKVLRKPARVLAILADMKPMAPVSAVPLDEVRTVLQHWLANLQQQPPESRYGQVLIAALEQSRGRSFDIIFVPGMAERMFPQKLREDALLLDKLRRQLSSDLFVLADRSHRERLLLQIAVGAAKRRLYLSYPRLEVGNGRARVPSFYALDVARSITGYVPDYETLATEAELTGASRLAWPAPRDRFTAIDDAEYDLSTLWPLLSTDQPRAGRLAYVMMLNSHLARSLRGRWARWQGKWSEHDGLFTKRSSILKILESQRLTARPYSVSALQNFAVCPYRFLLSSIYRLEPREELAPVEEMDAITKGRLFHRIQALAQRQLNDKGLLPVKPARLPKALKILDSVVNEVAEEAYEQLAPAIDRVWQDAIEAMRADLRVWLEKVSEQEGWIPVHFEFGFGLAASGERDVGSLPDPVTLFGGTLIHGVVDLIERSDDGNRLRVTDHKTGKDRTKKGIIVGQGEYLQPVVYGLAIEAALRKTVCEGRFFYCTTDGGFNERVIALDTMARKSAGTVLRTIDAGIAAPFLVAAPREDACVYCDFQEVCGPYEELRLQRKKESADLLMLKTIRDLT